MSEGDILLVASKLTASVKSASGFKTSDRVLPVLSNALRAICDEAIRRSRTRGARNGRRSWAATCRAPSQPWARPAAPR